jgi:hypothetical protein
MVTIPNSTGAETEHGDLVVLGGSHTDQQFVAGKEIRIEATVADDIFAAGGEVVFDGASAVNMIAAGRALTFRNTAAQDLIVGGGGLDFAGEVRDDMVAAVCPFCLFTSQRLHLRRGSVVGDDARLAGGEIELEGRIDGDLNAAGYRITLSGQVAGDANLLAKRIVVAPGARIGGNLNYASEHEPQIAADAVIGGEIRRMEQQWPGPGIDADTSLMGRVAAWLVMVLGLALLGVVLQLVAPGLLGAAADTVGERPWKSLGLGFAILVATPVATALLISTLVGIPLGLVVLSLYGATLGLALITAAYWTGTRIRRLARRQVADPAHRRRLLWTAIGVVVLMLVGAVPWIGTLVVFIAVLFGLGAFAQEAWTRLRMPQTASPAS